MHGQFRPFKFNFFFLTIFKFEIKSKIFLDNSKCAIFPHMSHTYSESSESGGLNGIGPNMGKIVHFWNFMCNEGTQICYHLIY